jgi:nitroimidazol reductase NimA-like FMN-containing flavoprotein (pyridoxamine 5'-phosphate oxidase superfamily)
MYFDHHEGVAVLRPSSVLSANAAIALSIPVIKIINSSKVFETGYSSVVVYGRCHYLGYTHKGTKYIVP